MDINLNFWLELKLFAASFNNISNVLAAKAMILKLFNMIIRNHTSMDKLKQ